MMLKPPHTHTRTHARTHARTHRGGVAGGGDGRAGPADVVVMLKPPGMCEGFEIFRKGGPLASVSFTRADLALQVCSKQLPLRPRLIRQSMQMRP